MDTQASLDLASAIRALATEVQRQGATPVVWSGKSA